MSHIATPAKQAQLVRLTNCLLDGRTVSGVFEFLNFKNEGFGVEIEVIANGKKQWIKQGTFGKIDQVAVGATEDPNMPEIEIAGLNGKLTEDQVEAIIEERFEVMNTLTHSLRISDIKSVIITGAAGIGKTFNIEQYLEKVEREEGQHWGSIGGNCTNFGLYEVLYEYRNEGSILVMDDVDVFKEEVQINMLKKALDTGKRRVIDWRSASKVLDERGLPDSFEFKGKIIFLTNTNMYAEIAQGTKRSPHLNALISRSVTLDLGIHCTKTILIHVRNVIRKSNMLVERGLTPYQQEQAIKWLEDNRDNLAALSLRTPLMMGEYMKTDSKGWDTVCRHTMLKPVALTM